MLTDSVIAYVVVPADVAEPSERILRALSPELANVQAIHLCREVAPCVEPEALPEPRSPGGTVSESWLVPLAWLQRALDRGLAAGLATRVVVRVDWPLAGDGEVTLLLARLAAPRMRIAVRLSAADAEEAFLYLNRLGFAWHAVPTTLGTRWWEAVRTMARLWALDPRTRTPMEPVLSAFSGLLRESMQAPAPRWRYRVAHAAAGTMSAPNPWSPSVHPLFVGAPSQAVLVSPESLAEADDHLLVELRRACASVLAAEPAAWLGPPVVAQSSGGVA